MKPLYITIFGIVGVLSRYYLGLLATRYLPPPFPYGTFLVNLTGAFLIGVVNVIAIERAGVSNELRLGLMVGFLGGYTTFSSYCLEVVRLIEDSEYFHATLYVTLSPVLGVTSALAGTFLTRWMLGALL